MRRSCWLVLGWVLVFPMLTLADKAEPMVSMARLPVKEVTVFKDGHSFVLHSGMMPTDAQGNVVMDYLPNPVLGTFWPYSADKEIKLSAVVAGKRKVLVERTSLSLRELLEGPVGIDLHLEVRLLVPQEGRCLHGDGEHRHREDAEDRQADHELQEREAPGSGAPAVRKGVPRHRVLAEKNVRAMWPRSGLSQESCMLMRSGSAVGSS